jgi:hypothetical protein
MVLPHGAVVVAVANGFVDTSSFGATFSRARTFGFGKWFHAAITLQQPTDTCQRYKLVHHSGPVLNLLTPWGEK